MNNALITNYIKSFRGHKQTAKMDSEEKHCRYVDHCRTSHGKRHISKKRKVRFEKGWSKKIPVIGNCLFKALWQ